MQNLGLGIFASAKQTGEDADHVAIHNRLGEVESDTADGTGGVTANAWQRANGLGGVGKLALMILEDLMGGCL